MDDLDYRIEAERYFDSEILGSGAYFLTAHKSIEYIVRSCLNYLLFDRVISTDTYNSLKDFIVMPHNNTWFIVFGEYFQIEITFQRDLCFDYILKELIFYIMFNPKTKQLWH